MGPRTHAILDPNRKPIGTVEALVRLGILVAIAVVPGAFLATGLVLVIRQNHRRKKELAAERARATVGAAAAA